MAMQKRKIRIMILFIIGAIDVFADSVQDKLMYLQDFAVMGYSNEDKIKFLRMLIGDTISFDFVTDRKIELFTKEKPDTFWIKDIKRKPKEGKDYLLNYKYEGEFYDGKFYTPYSKIKGKYFILYDVEINDGLRLPNCRNISFKLIDLNNQDVIECEIPKYLGYDVAIFSKRIQRVIDCLVGEKFYLKTFSKNDSKKEFVPVNLRSGLNTIVINGDDSFMKIESTVTFYFESKENKTIKYEFQAKAGHDYEKEELLSEGEYAFNYEPITVNSNMDEELFDSQIEIPIKDAYILGETKPMANISQTLDPTVDGCLEKPKRFMEAKMIFIGDVVYCKNIKFYKVIYNGKAFFINANGVRVLDDFKGSLAELEKCDTEQRDKFFNQSLFFSKGYHLKQLDTYLEELKSFSECGLSIISWGVYDESEYTDGTGINVKFYNPTNKIIKYITLNFVGYNAVDDMVSRRGKYNISRKCVGPIYPEETASYEFEYVWLTDVVEYAQLKSVVVQYMDNTSKRITNVDKIFFSKELLDYLEKLKDYNFLDDFN